jgi:hypothetical protein
MKESEEFERVKADYLKSNAALLKAVKQTTHGNCKSLENKVLLSALRLQSVISYNSLITNIRTP